MGRKIKLLGISIVFLVLLLTFSSAQAQLAYNSNNEIIQCGLIDQPGTYLFTQDLIVSQSCIQISASNVVLNGVNYDLKTNDITLLSGIKVLGDNVEIKNLGVEGFRTGVLFDDALSGLLDNVQLKNNEFGTIFDGASNDLEVKNSLFEDNLQYGLEIRNGITGAIVTDSTFMNNVFHGLLASFETNNANYERNIFDGNHYGLSVSTDASSTTYTDGLLIKDNKYYNHLGSGLSLTNVQNSVIEFEEFDNNIVALISSRGIDSIYRNLDFTNNQRSLYVNKETGSEVEQVMVDYSSNLAMSFVDSVGIKVKDSTITNSGFNAIELYSVVLGSDVVLDNIMISGTNSLFSDIRSKGDYVNELVIIDSFVESHTFEDAGLLLTVSNDYAEVKYENPVIGFGPDLVSRYSFTYNNALIDSTFMPHLDDNVRIKLKDNPSLGLSNPEIVKDGVSCTDCNALTNLDLFDVEFDAMGSGNYGLGESNSGSDGNPSGDVSPIVSELSVSFGDSTPDDSEVLTSLVLNVDFEISENVEAYTMLDFENSLIGHYSFEEGSTNTGVSDLAGRYGQAKSFDTNGANINLGDADNLIADGNTISFWANSHSNALGAVLSKLDSPYDTGLLVLEGATNGELQIYVGDVAPAITIPNFFEVGNWVHATITLDSGTITVYKNGLNVGSAAYTTLIGENDFDLLVGMQNGFPDRYFRGNIDELVFYNRIIDSNEVQALYDSNALSKSFNVLDLEDYSFKGISVLADGTKLETETRTVSVDLNFVDNSDDSGSDDSTDDSGSDDSTDDSGSDDSTDDSGSDDSTDDSGSDTTTVVTPNPITIPVGGKVYREINKVMNINQNEWRVTDPGATFQGSGNFLPNPLLNFDIGVGDLNGATSTQALIDLWGGHAGTSNKRLSINSNTEIAIPELDDWDVTNLADSECYMQQWNPTVEIPTSQLTEGSNTLIGNSAGQICHNFNWGQWGWYGFKLLINYDETLRDDFAVGEIISHANGDSFNENPVFEVNTQTPNGVGIWKVEFFAKYEGYDVDGDGIFNEFQEAYHVNENPQFDAGSHIGTVYAAPYTIEWNTKWVPDQEANGISIVARVHSDNGMIYETPVIEDLTLIRTDRSVKMFNAHDMPTNMQVRAGNIKNAKINVPNNVDLSLAQEAQFHIRTWNGQDEVLNPSGHYIKFNSWQLPVIGEDHRYSYDILENVPLTEIINGDNNFEVWSSTTHHGIEVLWPGPALLVEFDVPEVVAEEEVCDGLDNDLDGDVDEDNVCVVLVPEIAIDSPVDSSTLTENKITLSFSLVDFEFEIDSTNSIRFYLNDGTTPYELYNRVENPLVFGDAEIFEAETTGAQDITFTNLGNGDYTIKAVLVDGEGNELTNSEAEKTITVSVNVPEVVVPVDNGNSGTSSSGGGSSGGGSSGGGSGKTAAEKSVTPEFLASLKENKNTEVIEEKVKEKTEFTNIQNGIDAILYSGNKLNFAVNDVAHSLSAEVIDGKAVIRTSNGELLKLGIGESLPLDFTQDGNNDLELVIHSLGEDYIGYTLEKSQVKVNGKNLNEFMRDLTLFIVLVGLVMIAAYNRKK